MDPAHALVEGNYAHPLDVFVNDPSGRRPLCSEELFTTILEGMVADNAPRLFAIVQEYGKRVDADIAAWGMAFKAHAEVISADHTTRLKLNRPEEALLHFRFGSHIQPRLIWYNPDAATPPEDEID